MLMDVDTLATIQREHHQELMRQVEQERLLKRLKESGNHPRTPPTADQKQRGAWAILQQKLFSVFQMRIRTVLPH
jgi:hypothetical protein